MGNSELNHLIISELSRNAKCKATWGGYAPIALTVMMVSWVSASVQTHQIVQIRMVSYISIIPQHSFFEK